MYHLIFIKKIDKIILLVLGYISIQISLGYINFLNTGKFHIMTADSKIEIHRSFVSQVVSKARGITTKEFNYKEGLIVKDWLEKNNIKYLNKDKFLLKEFNYIDWMDYRREVASLGDKINFDNFIRSRSYMYFLEYPLEFVKHYINKSLHIVILNPFHIYSDLNYISGEIYYDTKSHQKYIFIRIFYTMLIYSIALIGLVSMIKKNQTDTVVILLFSVLYFFGLVAWSGNTRYFVPNLIYISFLFSFGLNSIYESLFRKKIMFN